ncbi:MAG TPA: pyroglutamyl-peptidase I [Methylomirabilota bacterium]|nr:pyroglutamyl-peptidase I [Methylomirabilota bacterium]
MATGGHVLITGFEPFGGDTANPSQEVAKALDGRRVRDAVMRTMILPVQHEEARAALLPALAEPGLRAAVMLGLAGGRMRIALERAALNVMDYHLADNRGDIVRGTPCVAGGPAAYWSTLPLPAILEALTGEGIPAYVSNTAGTFLCNYTLYAALHALDESARRIPAGFIHLPFLPSMVASHALDEPSMELAMMIRAAEIAAHAALAA